MMQINSKVKYISIFILTMRLILRSVHLQVDAAVVTFKLKRPAEYPSVSSTKNFFSMVIVCPCFFICLATDGSIRREKICDLSILGSFVLNACFSTPDKRSRTIEYQMDHLFNQANCVCGTLLLMVKLFI